MNCEFFLRHTAVGKDAGKDRVRTKLTASRFRAARRDEKLEFCRISSESSKDGARRPSDVVQTLRAQPPAAARFRCRLNWSLRLKIKIVG